MPDAKRRQSATSPEKMSRNLHGTVVLIIVHFNWTPQIRKLSIFRNNVGNEPSSIYLRHIPAELELF